MEDQALWQGAAAVLPTLLLSLAWVMVAYWLTPRLARGRRLWVVLSLAPLLYFLNVTLFALLILSALFNRRAIAAKLAVRPAGALAT